MARGTKREQDLREMMKIGRDIRRSGKFTPRLATRAINSTLMARTRAGDARRLA
jgi:hypothetical protein